MLQLGGSLKLVEFKNQRKSLNLAELFKFGGIFVILRKRFHSAEFSNWRKCLNLVEFKNPRKSLNLEEKF
jgi:hypothetical protein